jgi:hypothetical protein
LEILFGENWNSIDDGRSASPGSRREKRLHFCNAVNSVIVITRARFEWGSLNQEWGSKPDFATKTFVAKKVVMTTTPLTNRPIEFAKKIADTTAILYIQMQ